jgi:4-hydroxythreonine-4-phosphate dehydrogenase
MSAQKKYTIGLTTGDINGIGLEVVLKTFSDNRMYERITPVLYGSTKVIGFHRKALNLSAINSVNHKSLERLQLNTLNILQCYEDEVNVQLGVQNEVGGAYARKSLEAATTDLLAGNLDALVTAPINKKNIQSSTFNYTGHTEYLAAKTNQEPLMILLNGDLRVATVTTHVPVQDIASMIKRERIEKKLNILHQSLRRDFGIDKPRIAVLGLNPHAGDNGLIGSEEINEIAPAIAQAKQNGKLVFGPYSADGFFGSGQFHSFDAILAMYHDQGLIPFKTLSFSSGTNYTAGLNIVRTAPDHGTGFDIAGRNKANEDSFRQAVFAAIDILDHREAYDERNANPINRQELAKER